MPFLETSAKSAKGVQEAFEMMTLEIKKKYAHGQGGKGGGGSGPTFGTGKTVQYPTSQTNVDE